MNKLPAIKKACLLTDNLFKKIIQNFKTFKTEKDILLFIKKEIKKLKLKPAFPPVIASGKNASQIHHQPQKQKLKKGFCVIDFGIKHQGYCSDLSRTLYLGKPSKKEKDIYHLVLQVQKKAIQKLKINKKYKEIDLFARNLFKKRKKYFIHGLGHGLGKKIHQSPKISPQSKDKIKKGDIITLEPGLYVKNKYGLRIEDVILIAKKPQLLTHSPRKLIIII